MLDGILSIYNNNKTHHLEGCRGLRTELSTLAA